jgi:hypothetical protein
MAVTVSLQLALGPAISLVADPRRPSVTQNQQSSGHREGPSMKTAQGRRHGRIQDPV